MTNLILEVSEEGYAAGWNNPSVKNNPYRHGTQDHADWEAGFNKAIRDRYSDVDA